MSISLDWATYPIAPSAISNAVFDVTGVRLRSVPYTPNKLKVAMPS